MSQPVAQVGSYKNITSTGAVTPGPCQLLGFYVNSTSSGTLAFKDGGSNGTVIGGTITPAIGFHPYPAVISASLYATVGGTIDATFFYAIGH